MIAKHKKYNYLIIFFLVILSHFLPFERSTLAPDDYSLMKENYNFFNNFLIYSDRPLLYLFLDLKYFILKDNENYYLILLIIVNSLNCIIIYHFYLLFFSKNNSLLISIIYILLFNKLEIYHNAIMIHIVVVSSIYILSLYYLIKHIINKNIINYLLSIFLFLISILWYEIGFFIPLTILFIKKNNFNFKNKIIIILPFLFLMCVSLIYRFIPFFGIFDLEVTHSINSNYLLGVYDILNHYLGRYLFKSFIYGFYVFFTSNVYWFLPILILNFIFVYFIFIYFENNIIKNYNYLFFLFLFFFSIVPLIINGQSGGRNLVIPSVSISYLIFIMICYIKKYSKFIFIAFLLISLIVSQGNNFAQIYASNIQKTIFISLNKYKSEINSMKYLIFDTKSLTENIDHSFLNNKYNLLNTYYGSQVWEIWGILGYLRLNGFNPDTKLIVTNERIKKLNGNYAISQVKSINNKELLQENILVKKNEVFILNYKKIYNKNFKYE